MPTYAIVETVEYEIDAHCEACAKYLYLSTDGSSRLVGVHERWIENERGEEPSDAHSYQGGF